MKPKILSDITGNTHGIRFKMNPPIKPKNRKLRIPRAGSVAWAAAIAGVPSCQAARSLPLGNFEKITSPGIADKFLSGRSEERRVGKECRSRWSPDHEKKKIDRGQCLVWGCGCGTRAWRVGVPYAN